MPTYILQSTAIIGKIGDITRSEGVALVNDLINVQDEIIGGTGMLASGVTVGATAQAQTFTLGVILANATASTVPVFDGSKKIISSGVTATTLAFLDATSSIQTQLNAKSALASPTFTGTPAAPTALTTTNTTQIATTAFVQQEITAITGVLKADGSVAGATGAAQDFGANGIKADLIGESTASAGVNIGSGTLRVDTSIYSTSEFHAKSTNANKWAMIENNDISAFVKVYGSTAGGGNASSVLITALKVGIGGVANDIAALDVQSTTQGIRFPVMTTAQRTAITTTNIPAIMVFDSDINGMFYTDNTGVWVQI